MTAGKRDDLGSIGCWRLEGLFKTVDTALNPVRARLGELKPEPDKLSDEPAAPAEE